MAEITESSPRRRRRSWAAAEKRRIVELTLQAGASIAAIAREHGINREYLRQWRLLYRAGKLNVAEDSASVLAEPTASATFVPVKMIGPMHRTSMAAQPGSQMSDHGVVQLVLPTGATLRIETDAIDSAFVCALVAELRR